MSHDTIIIGAGLSGLAAGIRLAHFGKEVCILEAHSAPGGLNSYYTRRGRTFDVGLHAMTNYAPPGLRNAPLTKLLRQLRIRHEELGLAEQLGSRIAFPGRSLRFTNDFPVLRDEVARAFPGQAAAFDRLAARIAECDETDLDAAPASAREEISRHLSDPVLADMLLCPLMYYGNPAEDDMDFHQFAIMWKSIFTGGFARPREGMRHVIGLLLKRFEESGGSLRLRAPVERLGIEDGCVRTVRLKGGEELAAGKVLSSAGYVETMRLCSDRPPDCLSDKVGRLSFVELIACLDADPRTLGIEDACLFFNDADRFEYRRAKDAVDLSSGVICCPGNFRYGGTPADRMVRVTAKASHPLWAAMAEAGGAAPKRGGASRYEAAKAETIERLLATAVRHVPDFRAHIAFTDLFTPLTIARFSRHLEGAVYGSPEKHKRGLTPYPNLFLCGTDQGFLGIVGAMLSGISMANLHCLK